MNNNDQTIRGNEEQSDATVRANQDSSTAQATNDSQDATVRAITENDDATVRAITENNDATVRAPQESNDSTVRNNSSESTIRAGQNMNDATVRANQPNQRNTHHASPPKPKRPKSTQQPSSQRRPAHQATPEMSMEEYQAYLNEEERGIFSLNEKKYQIEQVIAENTGEGKIYKVKGIEDGKIAVAKIYKEPTFRPQESVIKMLKGLQHDDLLAIYDYGNYFSPKANVYLFFELMEFAEGGGLEQTTPLRDVAKIKQIISETSNALSYLHNNEIVHSDIKTANLLYRDKEQTDIILTDFGISMMMEDQGMLETSRQGTGPYMAPELLIITDLRNSSKVLTSYETDWYSLGIMLLKIWYGEDLFNNKLSELGQAKQRNKVTNKALLGDDSLDPELKILINGLTQALPEERWGLKEINQWLKGEKVTKGTTVEESEGEEEGGWKPFNFNPQENKIAYSYEDLGQFLFEDTDLGAKYLYRGKIAQHFASNEDLMYETFIEEITNDLYPKDKMAGVLSAAYLLNPTLPFIDYKGETHHDLLTKNDALYKHLLQHFEHYKTALKDTNNTLFVYMLRQSYVSTNLYEKWMQEENDGEIGLTKILFHLNEKASFRFDAGKEIVLCTTTVQLQNEMSDHPEQAQRYLFNGMIEKWLQLLGKIEFQSVASDMRERYSNDKQRAVDGLEFALNPNLGVFVKHGEEKVTIRTRDDLVHYLLNYGGNQKFGIQTKDSMVRLFMEARGLKPYFEWIDSTLDMKKKRNSLAGYSYTTAVIKVAKALKIDLAFTFDNGESVTDLEDLIAKQSKFKKQLKTEMEQQDSRLCAWIATFFHENPYDKTDKSYQVLLQEYVEFLGSLKVQGRIAKRFNEAKQVCKKLEAKRKRDDGKYLLTKRLASLATIIMTAYVLFMLFTQGLPFSVDNILSSNPFSAGGNYYIGWAILGIVVMFFSKDSGGCTGIFIGGALGGMLIGLIVYFVGYLLLSFIVPLLGYIIAALLALGLFFGFRRMWHNSYTNKKVRKYFSDALIHTDGMVDMWIKYAFSNQQQFSAQIITELDNYNAYRKPSWRKLLTGAILCLTLSGSGAIYYSNILEQLPSLSLSSIPLFTSDTTDAQFLEGTWEGTFEGRKIVIVFTTVEGNKVKGNLTVFYDTPAKQTFEGKYNPTNNKLALKDQLNSKFKGIYYLKVDEAGNSFKGEFELESNAVKFPVQATKK